MRGVRKELDVGVDTRNAPQFHMTQAAAGVTESTVFSAIGHTPLMRLATIPRDLSGVEIYAKAEWLNPGGSADRVQPLGPTDRAAAGQAPSGN